MDFTWIYWVAAFALLLVSVKYLLIFRIVSNLGCRAPSVNHVEPETIPDDVITILELADAELQGLGFHFQCYLQVRSALFQAQGDELQYVKVYYHPGSRSVCQVAINSFWQLNNPISVYFSTLYQDGFSIQTSSFLGWLGMPLPENIDLQNAETHDVGEQWQFHQNRLAGDHHGAAVNLATPHLILKANQIESDQLMQYWVAQGVFKQQGTSADNLSLSLQFAMKFSRRMLSEMGKAAKKALDLKTIPTAVLKAWDGRIIRLLIAESEKKTSWLAKLTLFVASAVIFAIGFGVAFSWEFVPVLIAVLLFHELGHFFAMKWTGYKDLQIFFIPLLGAAVTGSKNNATALQQLLVYLMGPMPGLLLSIPVLLYGYSTQNKLAISIGLVALIINYLNLLPITPLDGGRVLDTLLFNRFPRAQFIFACLSTGALLLGGIYTHDQILLIVGGLLVFGLPSSWTRSRINVELQRLKRQSKDEYDPQRLTVDTLLSPALDGMRRATKLNSSKLVLRSAQIDHASTGVMVAGLLIYLLCLLSPVVVAGIGMYSLGSDKLVQFGDRFLFSNDDMVTEENWRQRLKEAANDSERWDVLARSFYQLIDHSPDIAQQNMDSAIEISLTFDAQDNRVLQTWYMLDLAELSEQDKLERIEKAIAHYRDSSGSSELLIQLYQMRARFLTDPEQKIAAYTQLASALESKQGTENPVFYSTRRELAKAYYQQGQYAQSEQLLLRNTEIQIQNNQLAIDSVELMWFYRATQQPDAALKLANQLLDKLSLLDSDEQHRQRMQILQPVMWIACEKGERSDCLGYMNSIVQDWNSLNDGLQDMAQDEMVPLDYFPVNTQITAYHLLGETLKASTLAKTFLNQYPEFKPASSDALSDSYSTDWNQNYEQLSERIQNRYHIAVAYDAD